MGRRTHRGGTVVRGVQDRDRGAVSSVKRVIVQRVVYTWAPSRLGPSATLCSAVAAACEDNRKSRSGRWAYGCQGPLDGSPTRFVSEED